MSTTLASKIISDARSILVDPNGVRWTDTELLSWLNNGQRAVAAARADASVKSISVALTAGTRQALPADGIMLIDVPRSMGTNGATPGTPIRKVERQFLDENVPTWHTDTATTAPRHFTYDPKVPKQYFVYPASDGTGQVELVYSCTPVDCATPASTIGVDDIYSLALLYFVLAHAFGKNADNPGDAQRGASFQNSFENILTSKAQTDASNVREPQKQTG